MVSKPTHDQNAKNRPIAAEPAAAAVPNAPPGRLSNAFCGSTVSLSRKPSGPPPLKITENASASRTITSHVSVTLRIAAVRLMWKWHSAAMTRIPPMANHNHGMFTPTMVFRASLAKYAKPPISEPSNTT